MSLNNSRRSYDDCFSLFDRALEADRGIRIEVDDIRAANYLRMRMHHARTIDRRDNKLIYPDPEDAMHGRSIYDVFVIRIEDGEPKAWVYLDKEKVTIGRVEEIPTDHRIEYRQPPQPQPPMITRVDSFPGSIIDAEFEIAEPKQITHIKRRV